DGEPALAADAVATASEVTDQVAGSEDGAETAPAAAPAEPVAEDAAADAAPPVPPEEVLIEIWRPRRRHRGEPRAVDGRPARQGDRNRHRGRGEGRREGGRRPERPGSPAPAAAAQTGSEQAVPGTAQAEERREGGV